MMFFAIFAAALTTASTSIVPNNVWLCAPLDDAKLCSLAAEDQKDREQPIDWGKVTPRDAKRKSDTLAILTTSNLTTPGDYFHAALIMQHGDNWEDYATAHQLSVRGLQLSPNDKNLQRMVAASWDRMMHSLDKKQWFGTNTFTNPDGSKMPKETRPDRIPNSLITLWSQGWDWPE